MTVRFASESIDPALLRGEILLQTRSHSASFHPNVEKKLLLCNEKTYLFPTDNLRKVRLESISFVSAGTLYV